MKSFLVALVISAVQLSATVYAAPTETVTVSKHEALTTENVGDRFSQYVQINSILALVSRLPQAEVAEIVSNLAKIQDEHHESTNIGAYVSNLRTLINNQRALRWFDFVNRAGIKQLEQLIRAKPELFAPLLNSLEHVMVDITKETPTQSVRATRAESESPAEMTPAMSHLLTKLRHGIEVVAALGNISRITPEAASEIDAAFANFLETTGEDTTFGRALMRMRTLLKNRVTLRWFDYLNKAGLGRIEKFITSLH